MESFKSGVENGASASVEIIGRIRDSVNKLEGLKDFDLNTREGRLGIKLTLNLVFSHIDAIEKSKEYEVIGRVREMLRSVYGILYSIQYPGGSSSKEANEFYAEVNEILEMIEQKGVRFVEDMNEYKTYHQKQKAA